MNSEILALFLGMLCGDGHLSIHHKKREKNTYYDYTTGFCNTDEQIIKLFSKLFFGIFNVKGNFHPRDRINRKRIYEFNSYSKEVFDKISNFGFPIGVKRDKLRIPKIIKEGSAQEKLYFLQGVFLTDGCLKKGRIFFHSGSKIFLEEISEITNELYNIKKPIKTFLQKGRFLSYQLILNKDESHKILSLAPIA